MPVACVVAAYGRVQVTLEDVPALRLRPGPGMDQSLPPNLLKHADEQTIAGLAAVLHAIADFELSTTSFDEWGIVAAPCFLGRATLVLSRERFAVEGAWGLSPHFIPHRSQHAISGTISQVLKVHGPNFGAGGGPGAVREALVAGAVLAYDTPGVWVVLTGWEPELIPDADGRPIDPVVCQAVALALVATSAGRQGPCLHIVPHLAGARNGSAQHCSAAPAPSLPALMHALTHDQSASWNWAGLGSIEWSGWNRPTNRAAGHDSRAARLLAPIVAPVAGNGARGQGVHSRGAGTENAR
jgi:hypothetical protein